MIKKSENTKLALFILFSVTVVISNILSAKVLWTPFTLFGIPAVLPGSAFVYLLTFMISGLINELWGKDAAKQCVKFGLMSQILALTLFWLTGLLPANDSTFQAAYNTVLGRNFVFVLSDVVAGFTAQFGHVIIFPVLKKLRSKNSESEHKNSGLLNCISILISQIFDTAVFMTCAFGIGLGFLFSHEGRLSLLTMFIGQYSIKIVVCILSIPFFNWITRGPKESKKVQEETNKIEDELIGEPANFIVFYSKETARFEVRPVLELDSVHHYNKQFTEELTFWLDSTIQECENEEEAKSTAKIKNSFGIFPVHCKDCGKYFSQERSTVEWFKKRNLQPPKRCPECRELRKEKESKKF